MKKNTIKLSNEIKIFSNLPTHWKLPIAKKSIHIHPTMKKKNSGIALQDATEKPRALLKTTSALYTLGGWDSATDKRGQFGGCQFAQQQQRRRTRRQWASIRGQTRLHPMNFASPSLGTFYNCRPRRCTVECREACPGPGNNWPRVFIRSRAYWYCTRGAAFFSLSFGSCLLAEFPEKNSYGGREERGDVDFSSINRVMVVYRK